MSTVVAPLPPSPPPVESALPESEQLYEVVDGVRVEKNVSAHASWIANRLQEEIGPFVRNNDIGTGVVETVFILDEQRDLRRRPDVGMVGSDKWPVGQPPPLSGDWAIIPDLAVEVLSPNNPFEDMLGKIREYFEYGVTEVWIISPSERVVQKYRSMNDITAFQVGQSVTSELITGWSMPVEAIAPQAAESAASANV